MATTTFSGRERLALLSLAFAYALRMLGLYLVLPLLSPHAASLPHGGSFWVGMAVGAYGIAQALFQLPFGWLSDHFGRRRALLAGTALFVLGSLLGGLARSAPLLVLARFLQGMGAVASVVVAMVADLARPEIRQRAMAQLGVVIGASFGIGLLSGPILATGIGVPGLFFGAAGLGVLSFLAVLLLVPALPPRAEARPTLRQSLGTLHDSRLLRVNLAMMVLHLGLTALFVVLPIQVDRILPRADAWQVYAPAIGGGLLALFLTAELVDRRHLDRQALGFGAILFALGGVLLRTGFDTPGGLRLGTLFLVLGFAVIEPILPALVTHYSAPEARGTATGVFSMSQFGGAAVGGLTGAWYLARRPDDLFLLMVGFGAMILAVALTLPDPRRRTGAAAESGHLPGRPEV